MLKVSELEAKVRQASIINLIQNLTLTIIPSAFLFQRGTTNTLAISGGLQKHCVG